MKSPTIAGLALAAAGLISLSAQAAVLPLVPFNVDPPTDFDGQVTVDVSGGNAMFTFETIAGGPTTVIARIYFETGLGSVLTGTPTLTPSSGVIFNTGTAGPGPNDPPSANDVPSVPWAGTFERFKADPPPTMDGINVGESLMITYGYLGTEADLVAAITDEFGNSRLAVHVLNCKDSGSCVASAVPVPAAVWLFGSGLLGMAGVARRRKAG